MKNKFLGTFAVAALACSLTAPAVWAQRDDRDEHHEHDKYWDARHHDQHHWDEREDRAYHRYWEHRHRDYVDWDRLNERQREQYWDWRHHHSDAELHIDIR